MLGGPNHAGERADPILDLGAQRRDLSRYVHLSEQRLRLNSSLPHVFGIDVEHVAAPDRQACRCADVRLKRHILQIHVLDARGTLHLDNLPCVVVHGVQDVEASVTTRRPEGRFKEGLAHCELPLGIRDHDVEILGAGTNFQTVREPALSPITNRVSLVKDGLGQGSGPLKLVLRVVAEPKQLLTLQALDVGGFGEESFSHGLAWCDCGERKPPSSNPNAFPGQPELHCHRGGRRDRLIEGPQ